MASSVKPLGGKAYGHIPHLPSSRLGPGDHKCPDGQGLICTQKARDRHDHIIVQEKLDGSCVSVARIGNEVIPLIRAGYLASSSPREQHLLFAGWATANRERFLAVLRDGERLCGEWLAQAHSTRYVLPHEPFVAFDLMTGISRSPWRLFMERVTTGGFVTPRLLHEGSPLAIDAMLRVLEPSGHGAVDPVEGAVWRVERKEEVEFLAKWVKADKVDGSYLPEVSGKDAVWNWRPE